MTVRPPGATSILQAVEKRGDTDTHPSYFVHVILPFLITVGAGLIVLAVVFSLPQDPEQIAQGSIPGVLLGTVVVALLAVLVSIVLLFRGWYLLIKRRNQHFARDRVLRQGLLDYARRIADVGQGEKSGGHLESMQRLHNEALLEENERPAAVHILLYVLTSGLWGLYVLYFLLKDFPRHARRQARFAREARHVFEDNEVDPDHVPILEPLDERSYMLSLALWIFIPVIGPFVVTWWLYQDPIGHFDRQWEHEEALVDLVQEDEIPIERPQPPQPSDEDAAPPDDDEPEKGPRDAYDTQEGPAPEQEEDQEPEHTIWQCGQCDAKYKVPPKRPVRVTCKSCGHKEVLEA